MEGAQEGDDSIEEDGSPFGIHDRNAKLRAGFSAELTLL